VMYGNGANKQVSMLFLVLCLLLVTRAAVQLLTASNGVFVI